MKSVVHIDLNKLQLQNAVLHPLGSAPGTPATGQMYYDTGLSAPRWYDGSAFTNKATDSLLLGGQALSYTVARANHTGTQTASTISDLATVVKGYRLDEFAIPTADVSMNSRKITNLATPISATDAATMAYVDLQVVNAAAGIDAKPSVRVATTANITIANPATAVFDGVTLANGERILVKNQTTTSQNGPYIFNGSAVPLTRAADADANNELTPGAFWYVEEGTAAGKTQWRIENTGAIIVGTTGITINQFGGAGVTYTAGNGISLGGNAITAVAAASGGISVVAGGIQLDTAIAVRKFAADVGNASLTTISVTHNLGTRDVTVQVRDNSTFAYVIADMVATSVNVVDVTFAVAPTSNQYRVIVHG